MSVAEPLRHKGRLEVHIKAQALANYTSQILSNKKVFDPEIDEDLIKRMKNCAVEIYVKAWQANKIRAETNHINRIMIGLRRQDGSISDLCRSAKEVRLAVKK